MPCICSTPLPQNGLDPRDLPLRLAFLGAEPHSEDMRRRIEAAYGLKAYNSYGLSEMNGPGVAFECPEQNGMHVWEDAFLLEVLDPETLEPVRPGRTGRTGLYQPDPAGHAAVALPHPGPGLL